MTTLFDTRKPDAKVIRSPMGGGWIIPMTDAGREVLECYFGGCASPIGPLNDTKGYIVEPQEAEDLADYLLKESITWKVE